jgi:hypothetical protein
VEATVPLMAAFGQERTSHAASAKIRIAGEVQPTRQAKRMHILTLAAPWLRAFNGTTTTRHQYSGATLSPRAATGHVAR